MLTADEAPRSWNAQSAQTERVRDCLMANIEEGLVTPAQISVNGFQGRELSISQFSVVQISEVCREPSEALRQKAANIIRKLVAHVLVAKAEHSNCPKHNQPLLGIQLPREVPWDHLDSLKAAAIYAQAIYELAR